MFEITEYVYWIERYVHFIIHVSTCAMLCLVTQSCLTLCNLMYCRDSPGKNTGGGCHALIQGIFLIQGSNSGLLNWKWILYHLSHHGKPFLVCVCAQSLSHVRFFVIPWAVACQPPLSMGFPRQEYWSELSFPSPWDLSEPGMDPMSSALEGGFFNTEPPGKFKDQDILNLNLICMQLFLSSKVGM